MKHPRRSIVVCGLILVGILLYARFVHPRLWEARHRLQAVEGLKEASTHSEREEAVHAGVTMTYADGSWIAIYYADTHALRIQSLAIMHDSLGRWYESNDHYCALFSGSRTEVLFMKAATEFPEMEPDLRPEPGSPDSTNAQLTAIIWSGNPLRATPHIEALGFSEFDPD